MILSALVLGTALGTGIAQADVQRFAILVGNNEGHTGNLPLYFAETDAKKMGGILTELGGVSHLNTRLLLGKSRNEVLRAFGEVRGPIASARDNGTETVLYFFYSGHADDTQLQLGPTGFVTWTELETLLEKSGADVRVAFVDACQSGTLARRKGAASAPSFLFDVKERLDSTGSVIITSSAGDEASQESNEIGGSYFTHFLASALSGTADDNADGSVTLRETYQYVYHETVIRTSATRGGTQHPNYTEDLSGQGDIVITDLGRAGTGTLVLPATNPGTFAVFDVDRRMFVAEVDVTTSDRQLALRPGKYLVQRRLPTRLTVAETSIAARSVSRIEAVNFRDDEYEDDVAKGSIDATIRRANMPRTSLHLVTGARAFSDPEIQAEYFPTHPAGGVEARFDWRNGQYISVDFLGGSGVGEISLPELPYAIATEVDSATLGAGFGWRTRPFIVQTGGGLHLQGFWLRRRFPDAGVESQELWSVAPGVQGYAGLYPGKFEIELQLRVHYLFYVVDGRDDGMGFSELLLGFGYRF